MPEGAKHFGHMDSFNPHNSPLGYVILGASLVAQLVKNLPAMRKTWV